MLAEALPSLMQNTMSLCEFQGFQLIDDTKFELFQFADDVVLVCAGSWKNLWSFKAILRYFELVLEFCRNLFKCKLFGFNLKDNFFYKLAPHFYHVVLDQTLYCFLEYQ